METNPNPDAPQPALPPAARFDTPAKLAADTSLPPTERRRLLDEWEEDIRAESVATEEGMTGPAGPSLADILAAKESLPIDTPARPPSDSKA